MPIRLTLVWNTEKGDKIDTNGWQEYTTSWRHSVSATLALYRITWGIIPANGCARAHPHLEPEALAD
jgi:hypothetical protein